MFGLFRSRWLDPTPFASAVPKVPLRFTVAPSRLELRLGESSTTALFFSVSELPDFICKEPSCALIVEVFCRVSPALLSMITSNFTALKSDPATSKIF